METTFDGTTEQARASGRRVKSDLNEGMQDIKAAASSEIKSLIADVEDLMARIADMKDADVMRVRSKVQRAVDATKQSLADGAEAIREQAQSVASTADDFVRDSPWAAVGLAALVGPSWGFWRRAALRSPTVRLLWSLPKAAPALLRHLAAYVDLAGLDLARTQRELTAELLAFAVVALCCLFAIFMGCLAVVAYTWDTPHRMTAIAWMGGGFLFVAIVAAVYRANAARAKAPFLASVRREWQQDRVLLERILSSDQD